LQWLQNPAQTNGDNLNNVRNETSRTFRNKKMVHLEDNISEHETPKKYQKTVQRCNTI